MDRLINSGLFGGGLVPVDTPVLVGRYNACLMELGLKTTNLTAFKVDAVGWSPEVAQEMGDVDYLSVGSANRSAIILTPEQKGLPVHRPTHSFDRHAMEHVYDGAKPQIAAITSRTGLCVDFAQGLTRLEGVMDLLSIEWIDIYSSDPAHLISGSSEQRNLVAEFKKSDSLWADSAARTKLRKSFEQFGDMRFRSVVIPEMKFTDVRSFHTRIFGGVYVFRDIPESKQVLIVEDEKVAAGSSKEVPIYHISDPELPAILEKEDIVDVPLGWYKQHEGREALRELQKYLFSCAYYAAGGMENLHEMSSGQRRRWMAKHENELGPTFFELERFINDVERQTSVKELHTSAELRKYLMHPSKKAMEHDLTERVVWHIIARLVPCDFDRLFTRNKPYFYDLYSTWSEPQQIWAIQDLLEKGHPKPVTPRSKKKA